MAQKSSQYWARRKADEEDWIKQNIKNDADFDKIIQKHYDKLVQNINKEISDQYIRFAGREGMDIADAYKAVSRHDVQAFSDKAKEAVKHAREIFKKKGSVAYSDFDAELNRRLRLYNATMRINRLEYLKANLGLDLMNTNVDIGAELAERLKNGYTAEVRRQAGILGETMGHTNIKDASKIVMAQTKNANFSERLWGNSDVLKSKLDGILTQQYIQGINPKVIASKLRPMLADNVKNARYVTERLARTESARVAATAQLESFKKYGYKYVKWIAEPSACKICASIASSNDGVYTLKDVPYLPSHANCRCSISAWVKGIDLENKSTHRNKNADTVDVVKKEKAKSNSKTVVSPKSKSNDIEKWNNKFSKEYNIYNVDLKNVDPKCLPYLYKEMGEFYNKFPQSKGFISDLICDSDGFSGIDTVAYARGPAIHLNKKYFGDFKKLTSMQEEQHNAGYLSGTSVIKHEMGHAMNHQLFLKYLDEKGPLKYKGSYAKALTKERNKYTSKLVSGAFSNAGYLRIPSEIEEQVSRYANVNVLELFTEILNSSRKENALRDELEKIIEKEW